MAAQSDPEKLHRLNWRERWFSTPVKASEHAGQHHGQQPGNQDGFQAGGQHGPEPGRADGDGGEPEYGFRIGRLDDTLVDLEPGDAAIDAQSHAEIFLHWLQLNDIAGTWVRRSLLEKLYAGPFVDLAEREWNWPPECWQTVARRFRKLPGVKVRQKDLRKGALRLGSSTTDYWIPKCSASVVKLADRKRA